MTSKDVEQLKKLNDLKDLFLANLVDMVNASEEIRPGVTLSVGGILISGKMCSVKEYFGEFGKLFATGLEEDLAAEVARAFAEYGDVGGGKADKQPPQLPSYIHLKNAVFSSPAGSGPIPENGVLWRGRISQVGGFSLGEFRRGG